MYTNETVAFGSAMLFMFVYNTKISYDYCPETRSKTANISCNKIIVRCSFKRPAMTRRSETLTRSRRL